MNDFLWKGKVYFADTDAAGVVHHSQYLRYLEAARIDYFDYLGVAYENLQSQNIGFVPHKVKAQYHRPLRFADKFTIKVKVIQLKKASLTLYQPLYKHDVLVYDAHITFACMNEKDWSIISIPQDLKKYLDTQ